MEPREGHQRGDALKPVLACDLGGTRMKFGLVSQKKVRATVVEPARADEDLGPQLPAIKAILERMLRSEGMGFSDCAGLSISFPSIVDTQTGKVLAEFGKFKDAPNLDLEAWSREELGLAMAIENDARMAMIGEHYAGAGQGHDNLVMVTLGTGLGVSALIEGQVLRGGHGQAGILGGHLSVQFQGQNCMCGNVGCAEAETSITYLRERAKTLPSWTSSSLSTLPLLDYQAIFEHRRAGDPCAIQLGDRSLLIWSTLVVSLIHAYDPELVILGGGIMASQDQILPFVRDYVTRFANTPWGKVSVLASELGDGAALVAGERLLALRYPEMAS